MHKTFPKLGISMILYFPFLFPTNLCQILEVSHCFYDAAVNHLNYLGVQVTLIIGPWFLSIFVNILPWESGMTCTIRKFITLYIGRVFLFIVHP